MSNSSVELHKQSARWRPVRKQRLWARLFFLAALFLLVSVAHAIEKSPVADKILVVKSKHTMTLMSHGQILKTYKVALGTVPVGAKQKHGDHKTPEGDYVISGRNPHSQFHLSLRISYPNAADRQRAHKLGVSPGGDIMIHGLMAQDAWIGATQSQHDWTDGCIAVSNSEMDEIWRLVPTGTRVEIRP